MPEIASTITLDDVARISSITAEGEPAAAYAAIDALARRVFDHRLFTVTRSIHATMEVERVYSSNPGAYPVGGRKKKQGTPWGEQVLDRGQPLICHGPDDIRRVFSDHELILSLGIGGMVNIPVLFAGRSHATMNMSHAGDRFSEIDFP
ncbi:MAG TPA: GAF domain-containing protein, partial [Roseomonas sp.]